MAGADCLQAKKDCLQFLGHIIGAIAGLGASLAVVGWAGVGCPHMAWGKTVHLLPHLVPGTTNT